MPSPRARSHGRRCVLAQELQHAPVLQDRQGVRRVRAGVPVWLGERRSPGVQNRKFEDVENDLERGWDKAKGETKEGWRDVREATRDAWYRVRGH